MKKISTMQVFASSMLGGKTYAIWLRSLVSAEAHEVNTSWSLRKKEVACVSPSRTARKCRKRRLTGRLASGGRCRPI
jgi:hypothetical protein